MVLGSKAIEDLVDSAVAAGPIEKRRIAAALRETAAALEAQADKELDDLIYAGLYGELMTVQKARDVLIKANIPVTNSDVTQAVCRLVREGVLQVSQYLGEES